MSPRQQRRDFMSAVAPRRLVAPAVVLLALSAVGCPPINTKYSAAETRTGPAVSKDAFEGKEFNRYFPKAEGDFDVVFDQEKKGASIASLKKGGLTGETVATLSITDTISEPEAKDKFKDSTEKLEGFPVGSESKLETCVLVNDRFQVKVRSAAGPKLTEED